MIFTEYKTRLLKSKEHPENPGRPEKVDQTLKMDFASIESYKSVSDPNV